MTGEYLSPRGAEKVKLPVLNPYARMRKIQEYAVQLATDLPPGSPLERVKTRTSLVIAAQGRETRDLIRDHTEALRDTVASLEETNRYITTGVPDTEAQATLFEI